MEPPEAQRVLRQRERSAGATPSGSRSPQDDLVLESQRGRLLKAMAEVVAEHGMRGASRAQVAKRAGVSRAAFSRNFDDLDDCFVALLDWMLARGVAAITGAFQREACWDDAVLAGLGALLIFLDAEPVCARACLLESMTALSAGFPSRAAALGQLGQLVDAAARKRLAVERQPPKTTPEATVASVLGILRRRLLSGEAPPFVTLLGPLAEVIVAPYLGPSAAARAAIRGRERTSELLAEQPPQPAPEDVEVPEMLRHASSHRLRACLQYLADNPRASNGAVAENIGISHSGQVSTLLARLHDGGLLVKDCGGAGRSNAWCLSPHGAEVARVLAAVDGHATSHSVPFV